MSKFTIKFWTIVVSDIEGAPTTIKITNGGDYDKLYDEAVLQFERFGNLAPPPADNDTEAKAADRKKHIARFENAKNKLVNGGVIVDHEYCLELSVARAEIDMEFGREFTTEFWTSTAPYIEFADISEVVEAEESEEYKDVATPAKKAKSQKKKVAAPKRKAK
jgi:hypothetical protein